MSNVPKNSTVYRTARSFKFANLNIEKLFGISKLRFEVADLK